ncbi:unnamed protein product [Penicillium roqueforti FM164]|uniref:Genomic scaffold, ProqFM164S01 n=1 Tax=Penicillium roqueforti (strain FM164) TaxID=1365484 RepID=W6PYP9_PENRF|nr:unnamed protein product [Penicillium roqueforti FM164]
MLSRETTCLTNPRRENNSCTRLNISQQPTSHHCCGVMHRPNRENYSPDQCW